MNGYSCRVAILLATVTVVICAVGNATPTDFVASYTIVERDIRTKEFLKFQRTFERLPDPESVVSKKIAPKERALIIAELTEKFRVKNLENAKKALTVLPDLTYDVQLSQRGGDLLFHLQSRKDNPTTDEGRASPRANSEYFFLYDKKKDMTTSMERLPGSVADVWLNKGIDTRQMPFLLITGEDSPLLKPGKEPGITEMPVQAGPRLGEAGRTAEVLYFPFKRHQEGKTIQFTWADERGTWEKWVLEYSDPTAIGKMLPQTIRHTTYLGMPKNNGTPGTSISIPVTTYTATLKNVSTTADSNLFHPENWMKTPDQIHDYRTAPMTTRTYDAKLGQLLAEQKASRSRLIALLTALPVLFIATWLYIKRKSS